IRDGADGLNGRLCYSIRKLGRYGRGRGYKPKEEPTIGQSLWYSWHRRSCQDLDPSINGGKCRAFLVPAYTEKPKYPLETVWLQDDADRIIERRASPEKRRTPKEVNGRFLSPEVWEDAEYGICLTDKGLRDFFAGEPIFSPSTDFFANGRRQTHPALDPK